MIKHYRNNYQAAYFAIVCFTACTIWGCRNSNQPDPPGTAVTINVATVAKEKVTYYSSYPATVVALNEVELRSEVDGFITGIFFKEGQFIGKGKKLYEIDRSRYLASYEQAKANVDIATANVERAQRYVDRYSKLMEQDAIARQRLDDAQTDLQNANLELVSARAGLVKAQVELNYSVITAPFSGTIGISKVRMGTLVTPGQTLLNTISTDDPIAADIVVNEKDLEYFQELSGKKVMPKDSTFRLVLPDDSVYPAGGTIQVIDRAIDPQTGTIRVRLVFPNNNKKLRAGMNCQIDVLHGGSSDQLVIPSKALTEQMAEYFVFVVDSQKVQQTKVTLGAILEGRAVITKGLIEGQTVVTEGIQKLHDGSPVKVETDGESGSDK